MRTKKTLNNFMISTILTVILGLIGILKSKVFLIYLGNESTGIYQLFSQIYTYISLVDAGLTSSLLCSLYSPLSKNNHKKVNNILKSGRIFFNTIACLIILMGILLSFKMDFFVKNTSLAMGYIQICFIIFTIASAINYFVTTRKILFEAEQNIYYVHLVVYGTMILKAILEIVLICLGYGLLSLMILFIIISIIQNILIYIISKKKHKYLDYEGPRDDSFRKETKNLIIQRIGGIVFNNIDIVLISKFIGPASIVLYTCYTYITNTLLNIVKKIGTSSLASVGNLLVTEKNKAKGVFEEYNAMCFYLATIISVPLLFSITKFIELFYGKEYVLTTIGMIFIIIIFYLQIIHMTLDIFISALGYFNKSKISSIIKAIINLSLSLILINKFGISGILFATIISYLLSDFLIYPISLNKDYFNEDKLKYYSQSIKLFIGTILSSIIIYVLTQSITINNLITWFIFGVIVFIINLILTTVYFKIIKETKVIIRFINILKRKKA